MLVLFAEGITRTKPCVQVTSAHRSKRENSGGSSRPMAQLKSGPREKSGCVKALGLRHPIDTAIRSHNRTTRRQYANAAHTHTTRHIDDSVPSRTDPRPTLPKWSHAAFGDAPVPSDAPPTGPWRAEPEQSPGGSAAARAWPQPARLRLCSAPRARLGWRHKRLGWLIITPLRVGGGVNQRLERFSAGGTKSPSPPPSPSSSSSFFAARSPRASSASRARFLLRSYSLAGAAAAAAAC